MTMESNRRTFLLGTGLAAAAAGAVTVAPGLAIAAAANDFDRSGDWRPDPDSPRFTVAVMPDTQYLFDADRIHPAPLAASLRYLLDNGRAQNIVFLAHLGDLTENGQPGEMDRISEVWDTLDRHGVAYSVVAGNHDVGGGTNDQRGTTPYLAHFGPKRFAHVPGFGGATTDGYNTYHVFQAGGRQWLLLALDWRPSSGGIAWARDVIARHPKTPVILTTHELVYADSGDGHAQLSDFGQGLWDGLIKDEDQIFLTLNGHFWPPGRTTLQNKAGNDVHLHITNYQNRYYGGAAMIRLYHVDLARDTIDVETISPWILGQSERDRNGLEREELELTGDADRFAVSIDFARRFHGFDPVPVPPVRPARAELVPGTVAYWRFDTKPDGASVPNGTRFADLSGHGNDLTAITGGGPLVWSGEHHTNQPSHASLRFAGGQKPFRGGYLETVPKAPLNTATLPHGYTIEVFFKLPADWNPGDNAWSGLLSRWGLAAEAGKPDGDPQEPIATLSVSDGHGLQWAIYPLNQSGASTNWGHELPLDQWWHVAVVNDGQHTIMYVDGCELVRNPATPAVGITTLGRPWMVGGYEYGGTLNQLFNGWIGDVRIVDRPLRVDQFMIRA
jgi:hypothetical protein